MPEKKTKRIIRNTEKFKAKIRESQECLSDVIKEIEQKLFRRIKKWKKKDVKKLYNDYSMYVMIEDLLQVIDKASQRM